MNFAFQFKANNMEETTQIISIIPSSIVKVLVLNEGLITLIYFLVWKKYKERLKNWRIQTKEKVDTKQIKRELKNSIYTLLVGVFLSTIVLYFSTKGYAKIYTNISEYNIIWAFSSFLILLIIDDTWFYWCHRLLHHPKLFRLIHFEHHKSTDVNPFTSLSFHFLEPFLLSFWIIPVSFFVPVYAPVLGIIQLWGLLDNIKSHLGYEFYPHWWNKSALRFLTSSTHHNMHHSKFHGNYGVHFRFWDKLLKTEFNDYESTFEAIQDRKNDKTWE